MSKKKNEIDIYTNFCKLITTEKYNLSSDTNTIQWNLSKTNVLGTSFIVAFSSWYYIAEHFFCLDVNQQSPTQT